MRTRCRAIQIFLLIAVVALGATPALAVHNDGIFQVDGDVRRGPSTTSCGGNPSATGPSSFGGTVGCTGEDWDTLYNCPGGTEGSCTARVACDTVGNGTINTTLCPASGPQNHANVISEYVFDPSPHTIFTGGGSKDEKDLSQWLWKDGSVPDKDDLLGAFAALYVAPAGATRGGTSIAGHRILYFGANRLSVNGDAQIGFWFLQNPVALGTVGIQGGFPFVDGVSGGPAHHKIGDILILSNFVNGGGSSNIQVYKVVLLPSHNNEKCPTGSVETKGSLGDVCLQQLVNGNAGTNGVCNQAGSGFPVDSACAATNGIVVSALDPAFQPKGGADTGQYPIVGFFEGGLDLNNLNLGGECFATFVVETRSSASVDAVLKDFTLGAFERCVAEIRTEVRNAADQDITGIEQVPGTVIHDVAIVTGIQGGPDPGVGGDGNCTTGTKNCTVTFRRFATTDCTGASVSETVNCVSNGDGTGTCTATSSNFTTSAPPGYSYLASYAGDSNYPPIALPATSCESLPVGKLDSSVATHIYQVSGTRGANNCAANPTPAGCIVTDNFIDINNATPGTTVNVSDQALVTPLSGSCGGTGEPPCPTGNVTFTRYSNADCTGTSSIVTGSAIAFSTTGPLCSGLTGKSCAQTPAVQLGATGLSFRATYNGDTIYNASEASRCEPVCAINSLIGSGTTP